ncbi:MAG TPA: ArsA-related P-loop ATPase [Candidatus Binataceae bacterium]|nr:ArsA-related P-loop ATPase [Candidatus Binataceae bacterium]
MTSRTLNLSNYRLAICLGPGGVGKTTFSAALALDNALHGRDVDVMTIDPAPRLIDALGLGHDATELKPVDLPHAGAKSAGSLRAMRLDSKKTFDQLIERHAPSSAVRDAIMSGRIYQNLSNALAGVADYMAMERLLELYKENALGLIVLDTPPAEDALEFLDAPRRMVELVGSRAITLLSSSRSIFRTPSAMIDMAARAVLGAFDRITGLHLLSDVREFVTNFEGMYEGFAQRASEVRSLLYDPKTLVVLVTTTEQERIEQVCGFGEALRSMKISIGAVIINRMMRPLPEGREIDEIRLPAALKKKLHRNLADFTALKARETDALKVLRNALGENTRFFGSDDCGGEPRALSDFAKLAKDLHPL